jgi:hypothetical protein
MVFQNHRRVPVNIFKIKITSTVPLNVLLEGFLE